MRVSIIIPLYNKAPYIKATLESVLAQTMTDFEVIVVDDSRDEGPKIAAAMGDDRVQIVHFSDRGISAARNHGVTLAKGELLAFLDADDLWRPRFLEVMTGVLDRHPEAVAGFSAFGEGRNGRSALPMFKKELVIEDYPGWFIRRRGRGLWSSNNLVRKAALQNAGLFPEGVRNGEDTDTWFRLSFEGPVVYVPELLSCYIQDDAASGSKRCGAVEPVVIKTLLKALANGKLASSTRRSAMVAIDYFRIAYASALAMTGRRREALAAVHGSRLRARLWRSYARAFGAFLLGR